MVTLEELLDRIADAIIESPYIDTSDVEQNQKYIIDGQLQKRKSEDTDGILALFQKDVKANKEDLQQTTELDSGEVISSLQLVADRIIGSYSIIIAEGGNTAGDETSIVISIIGGGFPGQGFPITDLIVGDGQFSNTSQFIPLQQSSSIVDVNKANEFLDTNIFELLPTGDARQARIVRFFQELNALLPPIPPQFDLYDSQGNPNPDGYVDRASDGTWTGSLQYSKDNSISYAQENSDGNIDEEEAFIHRLTNTANDTNSSKTIEDIYNTILPYLTDILEEDPILTDERPEYKNKSDGYLQFRNLNQGIIIRNTNQEFVEGLDPNNLTYIETGFTITMWVRFLDKTSEGTLFNFGNPLRDENPFGFKLETYVLNKDDPTPHGDHDTWGDFDDYCIQRIDNPGTNDIYLPRYENSNTARYVRLVIRDDKLRDSHTGVGGGEKRPSIPLLPGSVTRDIALAQTTFIPEDFQEWYFICATYNPNVEEDDSYTPPLDDPSDDINLSHSTNYWLNHINPYTGEFVGQSFFGNKCKVEIISRSDLLRARGFKV